MTDGRSLEYTPSQERYFMTSEEKDAIIGRLMREHRENREHIGRLSAEGQRWGQRLNDIARGLMGARMEGVCLEGSGLDVNLSPYRVGFSAADFDTARLTALTNEYRAALKTREHLEGQLAQLGYPVPRER